MIEKLQKINQNFTFFIFKAIIFQTIQALNIPICKVNKNIKIMSSFTINQSCPSQGQIQRTQRIYIDPQQLIALKSKRKTFAFVPSIYQPPEQQDIDQNNDSWQKSTQYTTRIDYHNKNASQPRISHNQTINRLPHQKLQSLRQLLQTTQNISPNVQFVWKLLPSSVKKQVTSYQQGDCITLNNTSKEGEDKLLLLSGEVKVIGKNQNSFRGKAGYLFFLTSQTKDKIQQIIVLRSSRILKIPAAIYHSVLHPYMQLKLSQRINYLHFCPFFQWSHKLSLDMAQSMQMVLTEKQEVIYYGSTVSDKIYFVKEGIVLLERNIDVRNQLVYRYEEHYEKNQITEKDTILVVRKGMVFGIDGVVIKEFIQNAQSNPSTTQNHQFYQQSNSLSNTRIYTARTLGKCQLYSLDKKVLETIFTMNDINDDYMIKPKQLLSKELQKLSLQYTRMLVAEVDGSVVRVPLKRKEIKLDVGNDSKLGKRSKSLAELKIRSCQKMISNQILVNNNFSDKLKQKTSTSQKQFKQPEKAQLEQRLYINEEKEINLLRERIKSQRVKQKLLSVKKFKQNQNTGATIRDKDPFLPKLLDKKQTANSIGLIKTKNKNIFPEQQTLDDIINKKLKEYPYLQQSPLKRQYQTNKPQLSIIQSQRQLSNPQFINIKAYKSITSIYQFNNPSRKQS